jgi:nitrile hydratase accessory protein
LKLPSDPCAPLSRADGEVVFEEAWQAQALGLADCLVQAGVISASQWAEALGEALREAARAQAPDNMETYYNAVLSALETLLHRSGIVWGPTKLRPAKRSGNGRIAIPPMASQSHCAPARNSAGAVPPACPL